MALNIFQQPDTIANATYVSLSDDLWITVGSDQIGMRQFTLRYEVLQGALVIAEKRKVPNTVGRISFNVSRIIDARLRPDIEILGHTPTTFTGTASTANFSVRLIEEWVDDDGNTVTGATLTTNEFRVTKGRSPRHSGNVGDSRRPSGVLSVVETEIHRGDFLSVSYWNPTTNTVTHWIPTIPSNQDFINIDVEGEQFHINIRDNRSRYGERRVAWWDADTLAWNYFTFTRPQEYSIDVSKTNYASNAIDATDAVATNRSRHNSNIFGADLRTGVVREEQVITVNTGYLTDTEAVKLEGFLKSKYQYEQDGSNWRQIITRTSVRSRPNGVSHENFGYPITYIYANQEREIW